MASQEPSALSKLSIHGRMQSTVPIVGERSSFPHIHCQVPINATYAIKLKEAFNKTNPDAAAE